MIGQKHRFHGYGSLNYAYKHGKTIRGELTSLKYANNPRRDSYRLAVVVSKKVNNSAVARNRIRRRVYETFRTYEPLINKPHDLIFSVFGSSLETLPAKKLNELVKKQLESAGVIEG